MVQPERQTSVNILSGAIREKVAWEANKVVTQIETFGHTGTPPPYWFGCIGVDAAYMV